MRFKFLVFLVATRNIKIGDELLADYVLYNSSK
jgi:hypothetical protein